MQAPTSPSRNVMTSAELQAYQQQKDQQKADKQSDRSEDDSDSDDDDINYDSDDNSQAPERQTDQRKQQEAHNAGYRQQMMKTTSGTPPIDHTRIPSRKGPWIDIPDDDDDDDVPLAMLRTRNLRERMSRLAGVRSNPNLYAAAQQQAMRPGSAQGRPVNSGSHLQLPSFASNLPQDPFQISSQQHFTGGLVGVIANEERAKASRRGSPSGGFQPSPALTNNAFGWNNGVRQMASPYGMQAPQQLSRPQTPSSGLQGQPPQMAQGLQDHMKLLQLMDSANQHKTNSSWGQLYSLRPGTSGMATGGFRPAGPYGNGMGYAQSIPPGERSNVGLPSRYRPVSKPRA
ncbi:hypothetical protein F66182_3443 [Fusarium sp. NRRL 66182]|nr:hypothetical protein F66182_3443 [Fusarium sp. NRRL 66182]